MKLPSDPQFEELMKPVTSRLDEHKWEQARHSTVGAAGLSAAILFVVTQLGVSTPALWLSLFCSALAMPTWLTLWQIGEAYSFYGISPRGQLSPKNGLVVGMLLYLAGGLLLIISLVALIGHFSVAAALGFLFVSVCGIAVTVWHHNVVRKEAEARASSGV